MTVAEAKLELRGPMRHLFNLPFQQSGGERVREIMFDSRAGTGKSMGFASAAVEWCQKWPRTRLVVFSQERKTLAETFQTTFEEHVAPLYGVNVGTGRRVNKTGYRIPARGGGYSEIILGGLEDPEKWYSFEANGAAFIEANRISLDTYVRIFRALRWPHGMPAHFTYLELNPDSPLHWLYKRFGMYESCPDALWTKGRVRMSPNHKHNPAYWDEDAQDWTPAGRDFIALLRAGTEGTIHYERLALGLWRQAEGAIFQHFDTRKHIVRGSLVRDGGWWIRDGEENVYKLVRFTASMDWGMKAPGTFQVWGHTACGKMILVAEWYHTGWDDNVWAGVAEEAVKRWGVDRIICDSAGKSGISIFNDRLTAKGGRRGHRIAMEADKDVLTGISVMHDKLKDGPDGQPCILFLEDTLQHPADSSLVGKVPTKCVEELPAYVWEDIDPDKPFVREKPRKINDHGVDAARYQAMWRWGREFREEETPYKPPSGSMGELMGWNETMRRSGPNGYGAEERESEDEF